MDLLAAGNSLHSAFKIMKNGYPPNGLKTSLLLPPWRWMPKPRLKAAEMFAVSGPANLISIRHLPQRRLCRSLGRGKDRTRLPPVCLSFGPVWPNNTPVMEFLPKLPLLKSWLAREEIFLLSCHFGHLRARGRGPCSGTLLGELSRNGQIGRSFVENRFAGDDQGFKSPPLKLRKPYSLHCCLFSTVLPTPRAVFTSEGKWKQSSSSPANMTFDHVGRDLQVSPTWGCSSPAGLLWPQAAERVITVSGFSKTFSMTGCGRTLVANPTIAKAVADLQAKPLPTPRLLPSGALAAIDWDRAIGAVREMLVHFDRRSSCSKVSSPSTE